MKASVSVIIPCYCGENTIKRAILSVIEQTLPVQEIIIINDGSTDQTENVINHLINLYPNHSLKLISLDKNGGVSNARNLGWDHATSDYIAFLDADDSWHPDKIKIQYSWMKEHPQIDFSGHQRVEWSTVNLTFAISEYPQNPDQISKNGALLFSLVPTSSLMLKRSLKIRFNPQKSYCEDSLLWRELILNGHPAVIFPYPLAYCFKAPFGEKGLSQKLWKMEVNELDSYYHFWKLGYLNVLELFLFSSWSFFKYLRRLILSGLRNLFKLVNQTPDKHSNKVL